MADVWFLILGGVVGGLIAWVLATSRARLGQAAQVREFETRLATQEGITQALRTQLQHGREENAKLQDGLRLATGAKAAAEARVEEARAGLMEQRGLLDEAKTRLSEAFKALAADALKSSNQDFLALAAQQFKLLQQEAAGELESRRTAIQTLVQPLQETLEKYQKEARELEEKRLLDVSRVGEQLRAVVQTQTSLQRETANLVNALRAPQVRGRWGEIALRRTAELAGMTKHCDFVEQASVAAEGGRLRPDMIVRLPAMREIVVDAKVALHAYLEGLEAPTPEAREAALVRHTQQVKAHVKRLASKEYWSQFPQAPDFVVLFIPGEAFFAAAVERDPNLLEEALTNRVIIATPTTFIGLLLAGAYGWRQEQIAENAQRISELGRQVQERLGVLVEHLARIGKSLDSSVDAYNKAVASLETRVLPAARRFSELGVGGPKDLPTLEPVSHAPRVLAAREDSGPEV
jgi:DNA recombination protein RmuC